MTHEVATVRRPAVVLAHDYLTQRGGAERVALDIARALAASAVVTAVYSPPGTFDGFQDLTIRQSFLSKVRAFRNDARRALPLLPAAWRSIGLVDADVVICSSSGWSHAVTTAPDTLKIVYCHNPARWLYQTEDYLNDQGFPVRLALALMRPFLLRWDRRAARSADLYLANSTAVADRVRLAYGIEATVVHPPMTLDAGGPMQPIDGLAGGYFLTIGRARGYKGTDAVIEAFSDLPHHRLVVVGGQAESAPGANVTALGRVTDAELRWLYSNAVALVSVSREDFGLTPIEANAFGTPALLLRAGGFLDSTVEGVSGMFIEHPDASSIKEAVLGFPLTWDRDQVRSNAERFSRARFETHLRDAIDVAQSRR